MTSRLLTPAGYNKLLILSRFYFNLIIKVQKTDNLPSWILTSYPRHTLGDVSSYPPAPPLHLHHHVLHRHHQPRPVLPAAPPELRQLEEFLFIWIISFKYPEFCCWGKTDPHWSCLHLRVFSFSDNLKFQSRLSFFSFCLLMPVDYWQGLVVSPKGMAKARKFSILIFENLSDNAPGPALCPVETSIHFLPSRGAWVCIFPATAPGEVLFSLSAENWDAWKQTK